MNHTCLYYPAAERHHTLAGTHFPSRWGWKAELAYSKKYLWKRRVLSREWMSEGVMDDETGKSTGNGDVTCATRSKSVKGLEWGERKVSANRFQTEGEAHRKERSVIRNEDDVHRYSKKGATLTMQLCQFLIDLHNSFTAAKSGKFQMKPI